MCQSVPEPILELFDSQTDSALEANQVLYYRTGSSLELLCRVQRYWIKPVQLHWFKSGRPVSEDLWRGGIRCVPHFDEQTLLLNTGVRADCNFKRLYCLRETV